METVSVSSVVRVGVDAVAEVVRRARLGRCHVPENCEAGGVLHQRQTRGPPLVVEQLEAQATAIGREPHVDDVVDPLEAASTPGRRGAPDRRTPPCPPSPRAPCPPSAAPAPSCPRPAAGTRARRSARRPRRRGRRRRRPCGTSAPKNSRRLRARISQSARALRVVRSVYVSSGRPGRRASTTPSVACPESFVCSSRAVSSSRRAGSPDELLQPRQVGGADVVLLPRDHRRSTGSSRYSAWMRVSRAFTSVASGSFASARAVHLAEQLLDRRDRDRAVLRAVHGVLGDVDADDLAPLVHGGAAAEAGLDLGRDEQAVDRVAAQDLAGAAVDDGELHEAQHLAGLGHHAGARRQAARREAVREDGLVGDGLGGERERA